MISMMFPPLYLHTPTIAPSSVACPPSGNGGRFLSPESHLLHIPGCCQLSSGVVGVASKGERGLVLPVPAVIYDKPGGLELLGEVDGEGVGPGGANDFEWSQVFL